MGISADMFRREGEYWLIAYSGTVCRLPDGKGLRHLAMLLAHPGKQFSALTLFDASGGRRRSTTVSPDRAIEQARVNVTRALRAAVRRIAVAHPRLGAHFERTIRTGNFCAYLPDPRLMNTWSIA